MNDFGLDRTGDEEIERMSVYDLRNVLMSKGITVSNKRKAELVVLAKAAIRLGLESNVEFHEDSLDLSERLTIKGKKLPDPFSIPINEFSTRIDNMPPFGIEDIFNFLIFKSSKYNRQNVASYKAFEEYGLFMDGYVEELILKETCGHFIFLGKVKPKMSKETRQSDFFYKLWFIVDGERTQVENGSAFSWEPTAGCVFSAYCQCPGGQDGACKHIAAAMYSLHDCLHPSSGPTDKLCYLKKRS
eukprot:gene21087-23147_t